MGLRPVPTSRAVGQRGEHLAAAWYEASGYTVLATNWSCREGEVDIVARLGRSTVFCEVKSRSSLAYGAPAEAVGFAKQARLRRLAARWFEQEATTFAQHGRWAGGPVRFDVACVLGDDIEVLEGAF